VRVCTGMICRLEVAVGIGAGLADQSRKMSLATGDMRMCVPGLFGVQRELFCAQLA
jgi:hypothetical protein